MHIATEIPKLITPVTLLERLTFYGLTLVSMQPTTTTQKLIGRPSEQFMNKTVKTSILSFAIKAFSSMWCRPFSLDCFSNRFGARVYVTIQIPLQTPNMKMETGIFQFVIIKTDQVETNKIPIPNFERMVVAAQ